MSSSASPNEVPIVRPGSRALRLGPPSELVRKAVAGWHRLGKRREVGLVAVAVFAACTCVALASRGPLPYPLVHDEFSYLLAADTFAHGRLTNPVHPLWMHFESMHIILRPSYMAKYPPAQGLFLALGSSAFGHPIAGVYLSFILACTAICWMLQGWLPPRWALLGGVLAVLAFSRTGWANGYWGGAVACLGGALVFGAFRRLLSAPRLGPAVALGCGLTLLALSRPYEGAAACVPAAVVFLVRVVRSGQIRSAAFWSVVLAPLLVCLTAAAAWMGWYNYRVTGSPWQTPYQAHNATYCAAPTFLCQAPLAKQPEYHHPAMRDYYVGHELARYLRKRVLWGFNSSLATKVYTFGRFFVGLVFLPPVLVVLRYNRNPWIRFAALTCGIELLALSQTLYLFPHYAAPITCLVLLLIVQGMRHVWLWQGWGRRLGPHLVRGTWIVLLILLVKFCLNSESPVPRQLVQQSLESTAGRHLVVVQYGPEHDSHQEWVYNQADIDRARIVWARDRGPTHNQKLLEYYQDRKVWLLTVNKTHEWSLLPFPDAESETASSSGLFTEVQDALGQDGR